MILFKLFGIIDVRPADILDVLLISIIIYYIFLLFRGTRAAQMIFGGLLLILAWIIAQWWELHTVVWLISNLATLGIIALVILFQPEIRSALTRIGQAASKLDFHNLFFHSSGLDEITKTIASAAQDLAKTHTGALIVLEKRVGLRNYADTGEILDARISSRLLRALFFPNSALHDYGMRHRAAKALAAECDALVIVVSEETGYISIAYRNTLRRNISVAELKQEIIRHWGELFNDVRESAKTETAEEKAG